MRSNPFCSDVPSRRGPYSHGHSAANVPVTDSKVSRLLDFFDTAALVEAYRPG